jgi:transcriptional regulator with XRE-family HTH domain
LIRVTEARSAELKAFLRRMRARIEPEQVGLPPVSRRRRTSGLRIEEVASLAGVSLTWYTALETGKGIRVSLNLLDRVADALRLNPEERDYLNALARPARMGAIAWADDPLLQIVVDGFAAGPAFITDRFWDIHAYNTLADAVYGFSDAADKNLLKRMFLDPYLRELHDEWERIAREMVSILHASYARASEDPQTLELVASLRASSPQFTSWWDDFALGRLGTTATTLTHPTMGRLSLSFVRFIASPLEANDDRVVVVLQPAADRETARIFKNQ